MIKRYPDIYLVIVLLPVNTFACAATMNSFILNGALILEE